MPATEDSDTVDQENENKADIISHENDAKDNETKNISEKREDQTKVEVIHPSKLKRSESAFSKVSNVSISARNASLSSKVFVLEENLKSLQNIVGSLISQVDANNNIAHSMSGTPDVDAVDGVGGPKISTDIRGCSLQTVVQCRDRSTSMGLGYEQVSSRQASNRPREKNASTPVDESGPQRPATQPQLPTRNPKPDFPRSKTAGFLARKNKKLIRQGSLPVKFNPRQPVPTITEEPEQGRDGTEGVPDDTQDSYGELGKEEVAKDMEDTQGEAWISDDITQGTQQNEGMLKIKEKLVKLSIKYFCLFY